jgi:hypothetical protein
MTRRRWSLLALLLAGCASKPLPYGRERKLSLRLDREQTWAVAPVTDLAGTSVDPILQADLLYAQLQTVEGLRVVPVQRVVEVFQTLHIVRIDTPEQAAQVCELLGADALVVGTVTMFDAYDPPKFGGSLTLFGSVGAKPAAFDPRSSSAALPRDPGLRQAVGVFDAANGTVRDRLARYAHGRHPPEGPLGVREYFLSSDRYCGFGWHELIEQVVVQLNPAARDLGW